MQISQPRMIWFSSLFLSGLQLFYWSKMKLCLIQERINRLFINIKWIRTSEDTEGFELMELECLIYYKNLSIIYLNIRKYFFNVINDFNLALLTSVIWINYNKHQGHFWLIYLEKDNEQAYFIFGTSFCVKSKTFFLNFKYKPTFT